MKVILLQDVQGHGKKGDVVVNKEIIATARPLIKF
ncbi:MAG: hypothetical protein J6R44_05425 [Clostridia bacterium]|nr:hypothetical protein [Clostridia bacterium]